VVIAMDVVCVKFYYKDFQLSMFKLLELRLQVFYLLMHGSSNVVNMHPL